MHIVPAPAESLMKSRVLSIPGLQGVMDKGSAAFQTFRERDDQRKERSTLTLTSWHHFSRGWRWRGEVCDARGGLGLPSRLVPRLTPRGKRRVA